MTYNGLIIRGMIAGFVFYTALYLVRVSGVAEKLITKWRKVC